MYIPGSIPRKLLFCKFNTPKLLNLLKHCGSMPPKLLCERSSITIELRLQNNGEISPVNLLFFILYWAMEGGGIGSDPCSLLEARSDWSKLSHGRIGGVWLRDSKVVRKLKDRSNDKRVCFPMLNIQWYLTLNFVVGERQNLQFMLGTQKSGEFSQVTCIQY